MKKMGKSEKKYPTGATWRGVDKRGYEWSLWLERDTNVGVEIWRWFRCWPDGSGGKGDWAFSKRAARGQMAFSGRLKRVCDHEWVYKIMSDHRAADVCTHCGKIVKAA